MHLLVLSAFRPDGSNELPSDNRVSMHLLVLSAFRRPRLRPYPFRTPCLNAPFGAQCFPTGTTVQQLRDRPRVSMHLLVLSAFRQLGDAGNGAGGYVSMHLLVLSAFRPGGGLV